ncbi:MAG: dTDP-4-dehydrorhamnose 3,5-epimerase [Desulfobacula sp.]|nr:dTDP-4-dehydrorhamnose 3,5-epimerase [Desulfobacula sp.]
MRFIPTKFAGSYLIEPEPFSDDRGFFARIYCRNEFKKKGLNPNFVQCNISYNRVRNTLRGMHYQKAPYGEAKLVKCIRGAIYDVIIDLRCNSETVTQWFGVELTAENRKSVYIPEGFAHGFLTITDDTEVLYQMSEFFHAESSSGVRWNDPAFAIDWPEKIAVISDRDAHYPDFKEFAL